MIIGVTGGYSTGKTKVADMFKAFGNNVKVLYVDELAHKLMEPRSDVWLKIVDMFGENIIRKNGKIDRKKLSDIVFREFSERRILEKITHPVLIKEIKNYIDKNRQDNKTTIIDAPLLFEAGVEELFDWIIVVKCNGKEQIKRARERNNIAEWQIRERIRSQLPLEKKIENADFLIDNNGNLEQTEKRAREIWRILCDSKK